MTNRSRRMRHETDTNHSRSRNGVGVAGHVRLHRPGPEAGQPPRKSFDTTGLLAVRQAADSAELSASHAALVDRQRPRRAGPDDQPQFPRGPLLQRLPDAIFPRHDKRAERSCRGSLRPRCALLSAGQSDLQRRDVPPKPNSWSRPVRGHSHAIRPGGIAFSDHLQRPCQAGDVLPGPVPGPGKPGIDPLGVYRRVVGQFEHFRPHRAAEEKPSPIRLRTVAFRRVKALVANVGTGGPL